jgi:hypothetical protein
MTLSNSSSDISVVAEIPARTLAGELGGWPPLLEPFEAGVEPGLEPGDEDVEFEEDGARLDSSTGVEGFDIVKWKNL